jgi:hypothetical protein
LVKKTEGILGVKCKSTLMGTNGVASKHDKEEVGVDGRVQLVWMEYYCWFIGLE